MQNGKQSSDLVVAFFVPEWAERRLMVLVRKAKNRLETVGRKVESQIPRMAGGAYAAGMMTVLMCQTVYATDIFGVAKSAMQQVYTDVAGLAFNVFLSSRSVVESTLFLKFILYSAASRSTFP